MDELVINYIEVFFFTSDYRLLVLFVVGVRGV